MADTSTAANRVKFDVHICDQRRGYTVEFTDEEQALGFFQARWSTHHFQEAPGQEIPHTWGRLYALLYPTCDHGLSASGCYGPQHYYFDETEQAAGFLNS